MNRPSSKQLQYLHVSHCTFAVSDGTALILIDPFFSGQFEWRNVIEKHLDKPSVPLEQIRDVNAILISHEHMDHYDIAALRQLLKQTGARIYAPSMVVDDAVRQGLDRARIETLHRNQQLTVGDMRVTVFPAAASETTEPVDRVGFLIESGGKRLYHQGDSHGYSPAWAPMKGNVDLFIMWPWRVLEVAKLVAPKAILFHHLDRFTPGDFFCNRDAELELHYHRHYHPEVQFIVPTRGEWHAVP